MRYQPLRGRQVALLASCIRRELLPPVKRKRFEQMDPVLRQLEKSIQRGHAKAPEHVATILVGRLERESVESVCASLLRIVAAVRAMGPTPRPAVADAHVVAMREVGEAITASTRYAHERSGPARAGAVREASEAECALRLYSDTLLAEEMASSAA